MKNIILLLFCISFCGCSLNYDTSYFITNRTKDTLAITFFNNEPDTLRIKVEPFSDYLFLRIIGFAFGPSEMSLDYNDSIIIKKNDKKISFYRDDETKNKIFKKENWPLTKALKTVYEYKYTLEETDFN